MAIISPNLEIIKLSMYDELSKFKIHGNLCVNKAVYHDFVRKDEQYIKQS